MLTMIGKRLMFAIPSLIGVVIVTFLLTRALPGDPAAYFAGPAANTGMSRQCAASAAGWTVTRLSSFNSVLLAPAAAVRLAQRRSAAHNGSSNNLSIGPAWLNDALETPLALEARWLARGHTLPFGLSVVAVLRRSPLGP